MSLNKNVSALTFNTEAILDSMLKESTDCIAVKDLMGRYIWINPAGEAFLGKSLETVLAKTDMELFSAETAQIIMATDQEVMTSGKTQTVKSTLSPLNEKPRLFEAVKCPYRNSNGTIIGVINIVRNINTSDEILPLKTSA